MLRCPSPPHKPLANDKTGFSQVRALITWQSQRTHPLLFAVIAKQIMAEFQDNFQIIASVPEKDNIL